MVLSNYALIENRFFSGIVRIQTDRGHTVGLNRSVPLGFALRLFRDVVGIPCNPVLPWFDISYPADGDYRDPSN